MNGAAFFAHLQRGGGWMFAQGINGKKRVTQWIPPGKPFAYPRHWDGTFNVYFGVNQSHSPVLDRDRAKYPGKTDAQIMPLVASKNDSISALNCLIAEFDGKDFTYPTADELAAAFAIVKADADQLAKALPVKALHNMAHNLAQNTKYATNPDLYKARALAHVQGLPKQPSALVDSGGGYQGYWLLAETFHITNDDERTFAKDAQKRFTIGMGGDKSVKDLRRVLRVPGTLNVKPKYAPNYPRCNFVWCELDRLYTIGELLADLPEPAQSDEGKERVGAAHRRLATDEPERPQDLQEVRSLSRYAGWVAQEYNGRTQIATALLEAGYTWQGDRMSRPGEPDSKGVIVDTAGNTSFHFSGNDPLNGDHRRRPFDVLTCYDYNGDYEAAADAIGPALGIFRPEYVRAIIAKGRAIVEFADWSQIVPLDKQSELGYMTGQTDRKLFDNLLDIMNRAGRIAGVTVGYRQLVAAANADGASPLPVYRRQRTFYTVSPAFC